MDVAGIVVVSVISGIIWCSIWGVVTHVIAEGRGYPDGIWFWCGFLLGFIGLIIVLVQPNLNQAPPTYYQPYVTPPMNTLPPTYDPNIWICARCGNYNQSYIDVCGCGLSHVESQKLTAAKFENNRPPQ